MGRPIHGMAAREIRRIELVEELNGRKRVRAEKIQQMRGAADGGGFLGRDAAESEVVQLEGKERGIAGAHEGFADDLLDRTRERGATDRSRRRARSRFVAD